MSNPSTAAKVRASKERRPENFCAVKACLWQIVTPRGPNPCKNHPVPEPLLPLGSLDPDPVEPCGICRTRPSAGGYPPRCERCYSVELAADMSRDRRDGRSTD